MKSCSLTPSIPALLGVNSCQLCLKVELKVSNKIINKLH